MSHIVIKLFLLEKRLWQKSGRIQKKYSSSTPVGSRMFSMNTRGLTNQLRKFIVSITCLYGSPGRLYSPGGGESGLDHHNSSWKIEQGWTMGKRISSPLGELRCEEERSSSGVGWSRFIDTWIMLINKDGAYWLILDLWSELLVWFETFITGVSEATSFLSLVKLPQWPLPDFWMKTGRQPMLTDNEKQWSHEVLSSVPCDCVFSSSI